MAENDVAIRSNCATDWWNPMRTQLECQSQKLMIVPHCHFHHPAQPQLLPLRVLLNLLRVRNLCHQAGPRTIRHSNCHMTVRPHVRLDILAGIVVQEFPTNLEKTELVFGAFDFIVCMLCMLIVYVYMVYVYFFMYVVSFFLGERNVMYESFPLCHLCSHCHAISCVYISCVFYAFEQLLKLLSSS